MRSRLLWRSQRDSVKSEFIRLPSRLGSEYCVFADSRVSPRCSRRSRAYAEVGTGSAAHEGRGWTFVQEEDISPGQISHVIVFWLMNLISLSDSVCLDLLIDWAMSPKIWPWFRTGWRSVTQTGIQASVRQLSANLSRVITIDMDQHLSFLLSTILDALQICAVGKDRSQKSAVSANDLDAVQRSIEIVTKLAMQEPLLKAHLHPFQNFEVNLGMCADESARLMQVTKRWITLLDQMAWYWI